MYSFDNNQVSDIVESFCKVYVNLNEDLKNAVDLRTIATTAEFKNLNLLVETMGADLERNLLSKMELLNNPEVLDNKFFKDPRVATILTSTDANVAFDSNYAYRATKLIFPEIYICEENSDSNVSWEIIVYDRNGLKDDTSIIPDISKVFTLGLVIKMNGNPLMAKRIIDVELKNPLFLNELINNEI